MIHHQKYLRIKILLESLGQNPIRGIFRPDAYIDGATGYCTECQIDNIPVEIKTGDKAVLDAVLRSPVGFGEHLREGVMLNLRNGVELVGKAIVLEINDKQ